MKNTQHANPRIPSRRDLFRGLFGRIGIICLPPVLMQFPLRTAHGQTPTEYSADQLKTFMNTAVAMRDQAAGNGDQSYGAVVVKDGKVIGLGPSRVIINQDPTAHAEVEAIRDAAKTLGSRSLSGCTLFATSSPCRMCETAAYWANISHVYVGSSLAYRGQPAYSSC